MLYMASQDKISIIGLQNLSPLIPLLSSSTPTLIENWAMTSIILLLRNQVNMPLHITAIKVNINWKLFCPQKHDVC